MLGRVRRALDLQCSTGGLPQAGTSALTAMHGHPGMLGSAAAPPLGPWQPPSYGGSGQGLQQNAGPDMRRQGLPSLSRAAPAKRGLSPIAEHSDMSPVAVRTRAARRMASCADGAASCFAALKLSDKQDGP